QRFPQRWIGRRGAIEWPPRSPDLTPLDFFLWGHLKSVVYKTPPENINDLRQRIVQECRAIPTNTFQNVRSEFYQCSFPRNHGTRVLTFFCIFYVSRDNQLESFQMNTLYMINEDRFVPG
ncbi:hypothetical protein ALC60_14791, partial [Trachymyrmex zeteki]